MENILITKIATAPFRAIAWGLLSTIEIAEIIINSGSPKNEEYNAEFLKPSALLRSWNKGFCLTGMKNCTVKDSQKHALIIGGSGSGKSTTIIFPSILSMSKQGHSFVIHDVSGEIYTATVNCLIKQGYKIKILHFNKPAVSDGYNPLQRIQSSSDIYKTASVLVNNAMGKSGNDSFWNSQAISFISLIIMILKENEHRFQTLHNVKHLIDSYQANPELIDKLVVESRNSAILKEYKNFLKTESKVMANIVSTCRSSLMLFSDNAIAEMSSFDSLDFDEFRKEKVALFVMNKTSDLAYYAPLTATFFTQFFGHIMSSSIPHKKDRSIFFIIDEASSLRLESTLQIALANLRKYKAGIMLAIQDFHQLVDIYGNSEARAIRSNCFSVVYFTGQPIETAREIEQMLGKREYLDKKGVKHVRPLLTADEIRAIDEKHALIFMGSNRGIYAYMRPHYKRMKYRVYSKTPPPPLGRNIKPFDVIPTIGETS